MLCHRLVLASSVAALFLSVAAVSSTAYAQPTDAPAAPAASDPLAASDPPAAPPAADAPVATDHPWVVDADAAYFTRSYSAFDVRTTNLSFVVGAAYRAAHFELDLAIPMANGQVSDSGNGSGSFSFGNPTVGAYWAEDTRFGRLRAGASLSVPLAPENGGDNLEVIDAAITRSLERPWLWVPRQVTFAPSIRLSNEEHEGFQHVSELVLAPMIFTDSRRSQVQWYIQASQSVGYRSGPFRAGLRGMLVAFPGEDTGANDDHAQLSVMPYVGGDFGTGFVDLGLNVNLDKPLGSFFDEGAAWGLRLRGGVRF